MIGLTPRDHWEYSLSDLFYGLAETLAPRNRTGKLRISGLGGCIPVRSGRAGLVTAIQALNLPSKARIGVPLYCCSAVFKAIEEAGCTARFIDVEPETFCLSTEDFLAKRSQLDAVIAVHMYGNLCDVPALREVAQGKPIIEDCAQALGSKIRGRMVGSFGNIAFFSFRSGKYLSVGEGGALFSMDADINARVLRLTDGMIAPSYTDECAHAATTYVKSILRRKPLYGIAGYPLWEFLNRKRRLSEKPSVALGQMFRVDFALIRKRLPLLDSAIMRQRDNADFYSNALKLESDMLCTEKPGMFYNRYHFPVAFPSMESRDLIAGYLLKRRIDTMKYLGDIVEIATEQYGYTGDCPVAERLSKRTLIIPSYYSLQKSEIERIAERLNEGWAEARGRSKVVRSMELLR
ncbi:MAG: DegT/DnrJ/EryC1/StrS family aminotransferase [Nitrospira sp.]|nr:DegT/DnrJ/EryC1/StrS family aminotransferase [Nitrospira sp.]